MAEFDFTNNWFDSVPTGVWEQILNQTHPKKILEVGSYEGASACFLINLLASRSDIEIHCVDTWEGGIEHQEILATDGDKRSLEARFHHNVNLAIEKVGRPVAFFAHKGTSDLCLAKLLSEGKRNYFDFIYIDGSHQAPDVLCDAVLGFRLLKAGGIMAFDDYLWAETLPYGKDPIRCPKPAIDAFVNLNIRKLQVLQAPLYQLYIQKLSD